MEYGVVAGVALLCCKMVFWSTEELRFPVFPSDVLVYDWDDSTERSKF